MPCTIDSHHHLWCYGPAEYPWIGPAMDVLKRDYLPGDLKAEIDASGVRATVAVQARQTVAETEWLLAQAAASTAVRGVVGWVPLVDDRVQRTLERLAADARLKGVRHVLQDEPDPGYMLRDDFNRGLAALRPLGLVYDLLVFARQLPEAVQLVDRHPSQPFVVDHIAKPTIRASTFDRDWASGIAELARRPNVSCKLSGVLTEVRDPDWTPDLVRPYVETVLNEFGPDRLMFGSDWPVCRLRCEYRDWVETVRELLSGLSASEQDRVFGLTAARVYGLSATG